MISDLRRRPDGINIIHAGNHRTTGWSAVRRRDMTVGRNRLDENSVGINHAPRTRILFFGFLRLSPLSEIERVVQTMIHAAYARQQSRCCNTEREPTYRRDLFFIKRFSPDFNGKKVMNKNTSFLIIDELMIITQDSALFFILMKYILLNSLTATRFFELRE